jgi:pimeloyl-ACP methyl ester carboxylesterase
LAATNFGWGSVLGSPEVLAVLATPLLFYSASYFDRVAADVYGGVTGRDAAKRQGASGARRRFPPTQYGYQMQLLGALGWSSWSFLPDIAHETLVVCGDDDPLVPIANARMIAGRMPRAQLAIVERAGHLLLWDEPERIAPQIGQFVGWG